MNECNYFIYGRSGGPPPEQFWKTYFKITYFEAFGLKKGGWRGRGGGHKIFSSDLHWSQEWSRWVQKSLKAWKAWKRLTPAQDIMDLLVFGKVQWINFLRGPYTCQMYLQQFLSSDWSSQSTSPSQRHAPLIHFPLLQRYSPFLQEGCESAGK